MYTNGNPEFIKPFYYPHSHHCVCMLILCGNRQGIFTKDVSHHQNILYVWTRGFKHSKINGLYLTMPWWNRCPIKLEAPGCMSLLRWHCSHSWHQRAMSLTIPGQYHLSHTNSIVRPTPWCPYSWCNPVKTSPFKMDGKINWRLSSVPSGWKTWWYMKTPSCLTKWSHWRRRVTVSLDSNWSSWKLENTLGLQNGSIFPITISAPLQPLNICQWITM